MVIQCKKIISSFDKKQMDDSPWVKLGKYYIVLAMVISPDNGTDVLIQTENFNDPGFQSLDCFEIISQYQPKSWVKSIDRVYDKEIISILPKSWDYQSFFEDLLDEEDKAVELFVQETAKIYMEELPADFV